MVTNKNDPTGLWKTHELTEVQQKYVSKLYKRERGENWINEEILPQHRSVMPGRYKFKIGEDPYGLQRHWPKEKPEPEPNQEFHP